MGDLGKNMIPLLCCFKFFASFHSHGCFQISSYSPKTPNLGQNRWCFVSRVLEIWQMTLKNNRTPLICYFKLCASFQSHWWFQTGGTVRKRPIWVKIDDCFRRVTLKLDGRPWKSIGQLSLATPSFVQHFVFICKFIHGPETAKLGFELCNIDLWILTNVHMHKNNTMIPSNVLD